MKPIPAIVERDHDRDVARAAQAVDHAMTVLAVAEANVRARRLELGRALIAARKLFPATGRNAGGWSRFVADRKLNMDVALDAMKYAGYVDEYHQPGDPLPSRQEAGIDRPPEKGSAAAGGFQGAPLTLVPDPEPEVDIDRDTWCTPRWITDAIGEFDLDPCANERSHVPARTQFDLEHRGEDGLARAADIGRDWRVFLNPPYSDVMPWVKAYAHTRFCFLLKLDPSTKWFAELYARTELILIPRGTRIQFEAPPGVPPDKAVANQFPHALFFRRYADASAAIYDLCFPWQVEHPNT